MEKIKPGDKVTMVRDRDCIVDGRYSVSVFYKNDFANIMGHIRRIYREDMLRLIDRYGKVHGSISSVGETTCMLNVGDVVACDNISRTDTSPTSQLSPGVIDESLIISSNKEDTSLEMLADTILSSTDRRELIDTALLYIKVYGHSISGDHERDYKRIVSRLNDVLAVSDSIDAPRITEILDKLDRKNRWMTSGDNVVSIFYEQLARLKKTASVRGGMFDRLFSRYFHSKQCVPVEHILELKNKVKEWLNSQFDNLYYADMPTFIKRIAYEGLSTRDLYTVMTYILVHQRLREEVARLNNVSQPIDEAKRDEIIRRAIVAVMETKMNDKHIFIYSRQWIGIFRIMVDEGIIIDNAFRSFHDYVMQLFPDGKGLRVKIDMNNLSHAYMGIFARPFSQWDFKKYKGLKGVFDRNY
ncbi:MAG: hypothetical protein Q4F34_06045, partial [Prevotellaceae bacterium]|nr:hypothetical protein [Prevotellaceae bacterium]